MGEFGDVEEDQPRLPAHDVESDRPEDEADEDREDRLRNVVTAQPDEGGEREHHEREDLRVAELQRDGRQRRRERGEKDVRHGAADERGDRSSHQGDLRLARERKRPAVEGGGDGGGCAGNAEGDGGDRAAVHGAVVDRREENHRRSRGARDLLDHEREGEEDRHAVHGAEARHRPDEQADDHAEHREAEIDRLQGGDDPVEEKENDFHAGLLPASDRGEGAQVRLQRKIA